MISVGIASIPARVESLLKTIDSLHNQCDIIWVALNGHKGCPDELLKYKNVVPFLADNSRGDAEKFRYVDRNSGYYFSCDDDLIYPHTYIRDMVKAIDKYKGAVSCHGRTYLSPIKSFKRWAGNYRCLNTVKEDVKVNLIGTGCLGFNVESVSISIHDFPTPNMADCYFSRKCHVQGVPMIVLAHKAGYIKYCPPKDKKTIWNTTKDYSLHTKVLQSYLG